VTGVQTCALPICPANVDPASASTITYDITLANNGPSDSGPVTLTDPAPPFLMLGNVSGDCTKLPCAIASIPNGQTKSVQTTYTVKGGAAGTTITNTAGVSSADDGNTANDASSVATSVASCPAITMVHPAPGVDGLSTNNPASVPPIAGATYAWSITNGTITSGQGTNAIRFTAGATGSVGLSVTVTIGVCVIGDSATIPIIGAAEVTITKSGPASVSPATSSKVTYSITVKNNGAIAATDVEIEDPTPSGLTFVSATGACTAFPCTVGTLPAGASANVQSTYSFSGAATSQTISNVATVIASNDVDPSNNSATMTTTISACPGVTISAPVKALPLQSSTASATDIPGATYSWSIVNGTITSGANTKLVSFTAGNYGPMTLTVHVVAGQCDVTTSQTVDVTSADLTIAVTAPAEVEKLTQFDYTIVVTNNGPGSADSFVVKDVLPMTFSSVSPAASCAGTSTVTCTFGMLAPGDTQTVIITVTTSNTTTTLVRNNSASVSSPDDAITSNNSALVTTYVQPCFSAVPVLLTPAANTTTTTHSPITFSWTPVSGVSSYQVVATINGDPIALNSVGPGTTSITSSFFAGTFDWTVRTTFLPGNCATSTTPIRRTFIVTP